MLSLPASEADAKIASYQAGFTWLSDPARVTIAAVQGHAIGAGFQLALACDFRVLTEDAQFCMAETGLGLVPDLGGTLPLVRLVGYSRAAEMCGAPSMEPTRILTALKPPFAIYDFSWSPMASAAAQPPEA